MNISGVRGGFITANDIISDISMQELEAANLQLEQEKEELDNAQLDAPQLASIRENQTFGSIDYAQTYQPNQTYEMAGKDSDIHTLDVEKALSDLKKDEVIQQYQFFVGSSYFNKDAGIDNTTANSMSKIQDFSL